MKDSNYLIFGGVILAVIVVFIIVLLIIKKPKPKQKDTFSQSNCIKNQMSFTDVTNSKPCVNTAGGVGKPAFILFIRHCDRGYVKDPTQPNPPVGANLPPGVKRTTCDHQTTWTDCLGCEYMDSNGGCASNDCSEEGLNRAWALGKWIDCFSKSKSNIPVAAVVGQVFVGGISNARPMTTASIILDSLINLGHNPCYLTGNKGGTAKIGPLVNTPAFDGKIVVIVWDHGELTGLINQVTGVSNGYHNSGKIDSKGQPIYVPNVPAIIWDDCCFDQVTVVDKTSPLNTSATAYNAMSLKDNDLCGSKCIGKTTPYPLCSYDLFADKTSPTICPN